MRRLFGRKGQAEEQRDGGEPRQWAREGLRKSRETWFSRVAALFRGGEVSPALWEELEELLVSADVGVTTTAQLLERVRARAEAERRTEAEAVFSFLKEEMVALLEEAAPPRGETPTPQPPPLVILVVGVNGTGKTTSIAKLAYQSRQEGMEVVLGAADTFRAAAIEQLQAWGRRLGAEVIAHRPGSDPGAVAHDAYQAARARNADVVIIDTAGRLHTKSNLMEELKKVHRVLQRLDPAAPHQVLLVLDATTGQNGLAQARHFTEAAGCSGVFLAKLDGTAKGGIVLAIARELGLPVLFVGTGEGLEDVAPFDPRLFVEALFTPETQEAAYPR